MMPGMEISDRKYDATIRSRFQYFSRLGWHRRMHSSFPFSKPGRFSANLILSEA
jgi:hypothetical protein